METKEKRRKSKLPYNCEDVCHVLPAQIERAKQYRNWIKLLMYLLLIQKLGDKDVHNLHNFSNAKHVLTIVRTGSGT